MFLPPSSGSMLRSSNACESNTFHGLSDIRSVTFDVACMPWCVWSHCKVCRSNWARQPHTFDRSEGQTTQSWRDGEEVLVRAVDTVRHKSYSFISSILSALLPSSYALLFSLSKQSLCHSRHYHLKDNMFALFRALQTMLTFFTYKYKW